MASHARGGDLHLQHAISLAETLQQLGQPGLAHSVTHQAARAESIRSSGAATSRLLRDRLCVYCSALLPRGASAATCATIRCPTCAAEFVPATTSKRRRPSSAVLDSAHGRSADGASLSAAPHALLPPVPAAPAASSLAGPRVSLASLLEGMEAAQQASTTSSILDVVAGQPRVALISTGRPASSGNVAQLIDSKPAATVLRTGSAVAVAAATTPPSAGDAAAASVLLLDPRKKAKKGQGAPIVAPPAAASTLLSLLGGPAAAAVPTMNFGGGSLGLARPSALGLGAAPSATAKGVAAPPKPRFSFGSAKPS